MAGDGTEPIAADEILLRCIPRSIMDGGVPPRTHRDAFLPKKRDTDGLSIFRQKYIAPEDAAAILKGPVYYVAQYRAGDLMAEGMDLKPCPTRSSKGHAVIANMNAGNRRSDQTMAWAYLLNNELQCGFLLGPYRK